MKVFLDTNVLVSAFVARGLCADLVRYVLADHQLLTGEVNLIELRRTLRDRFEASAEQIGAMESQLRDQTIVPKPASRPAVHLRDTDDEWVLASAVASGADMLVTGDRELLAVAPISPVPVLTPREAWTRLREISEGAV